MTTFEFPLQWLPQQARTQTRKHAKFGAISVSRAGDELVNELKLLGGKNYIVSSNLQMRRDGKGFYSDQRVADPGVVVYFDLKGKPKAMACDRWTKVEHNLRALTLSISAIRGLNRWGGSDFLDGLFTGFSALPSPDQVIQAGPAYFADCINADHARELYVRLAKELHPDVGGNAVEFAEMKRQYDALRWN